MNIIRLRYTLAGTRLRRPLAWYRHRGLNPANAYLASYPRSGNTWVKFVLFEILTGEKAEFASADAAVPLIGWHRRAAPHLVGEGCLIKTHEPYRREYKKGVYLVRDVRDVVLAEFAFHRWRGVEDEDFDDFLSRFLRRGVWAFGTWANHVRSWLDARDVQGQDILVIKYEDLRQSTEQAFLRIVEFLGIKADREKVRKAIESNTISRMQDKEQRAKETLFKKYLHNYSADQRFVRSGSSGRWRGILRDDQLTLIQEHAGSVLARLTSEV